MHEGTEVGHNALASPKDPVAKADHPMSLEIPEPDVGKRGTLRC